MNPQENPFFLVLQVPDLVAARKCFRQMQPSIPLAGGTVLAAALPRDVEVLEAGTRLAAILIARWPHAHGVDSYWSTAEARDAFTPIAAIPGACALSVQGVPTAGLPDSFLPTIATVTAPELQTPPAYMLVQGSVTNLAPIQEYAGIIMPMLRERMGYYIVYAEAADVTVRHGSWHDQALIISRWPTLAAAQDFWYCDRYQDVAIPTRTGHGTFTVQLMPGLAG